MTTSEWINAFISLLGLLVAGGGLIAVCVQVRQVRNQLKLQNYSEYTRRYAEIVFRLPEEVNDENFSLDEREDRPQIMRVFRAFFDLCFEEYDLHNRKLVDEDAWQIWSGGIETAMSRPAFRQAWQVVRDTSGFGWKFNDYMNELCYKKPAKQA